MTGATVASWHLSFISVWTILRLLIMLACSPCRARTNIASGRRQTRHRTRHPMSCTRGVSPFVHVKVRYWVAPMFNLSADTLKILREVFTGTTSWQVLVFKLSPSWPPAWPLLSNSTIPWFGWCPTSNGTIAFMLIKLLFWIFRDHWQIIWHACRCLS